MKYLNLEGVRYLWEKIRGFFVSKFSFLNGYDIYTGNSYSGYASDSGIEILRIKGNYKQEGIPSPTNKINPLIFKTTNIYTNSIKGDLSNPENTIPFEVELKGLPNGICDIYENGKIYRYISFEDLGASNHRWSQEGSISGQGTVYTCGSVLPTSGVYSYNKDNFLCNCFRIIDYTEKDSAILNDLWVDNNGDVSVCIRVPSEYMGKVDDYIHDLVAYLYYGKSESTIDNSNIINIPSHSPYANVWHDGQLEASEFIWKINAQIKESIPIFGTLFYPHDKEAPSGYEKTEEYYIPVDYIGIDENTTLMDEINNKTSIKKSGSVVSGLEMTESYTSKPNSIKVQLKDTNGNVIYLATSVDNVFIIGTDNSEIGLDDYHAIVAQLINSISYFSVNPVNMLAQLNKYTPTTNTLNLTDNNIEEEK